MRKAIEVALEGIKKGQTPFGCVIVKGNEIISAAHNTVLQDNDPTAHAEINAIRQAAKELNTYHLKGCILYSTCEPCPMCFSAAHWANMEGIVFGAYIEDAAALGFRELMISNKKLKELGKSDIKFIIEGVLRDECVKMMNKWRKGNRAKTY